MSSDIPRARELLEDALQSARTIAQYRIAMINALKLMKRAVPEFKAPAQWPKLDEEQAAEALRLRNERGMGVEEIARELGTTSGRVSEVINPKAT